MHLGIGHICALNAVKRRMRREGFEPSKALSHLVLSQTHLAALVSPRKNVIFERR